MALAFTEDLNAFFDTPGFTVPVVQGSTTSVGYFESPNEIIADGVVLTTDYAVVVKTSDFSTVSRGDAMTVEGVAYTVREHNNGFGRHYGGRHEDLSKSS